MLALIYVRVSTEEQAKRGYSIPEQIAECKQRAAQLGATDTVEFVDDVGGDFLERPKLEQARQLVRSKKVKWFICFDPDRFSRNLLNQLLVTDEIDKAGVELVFLQHRREKTAEGNLFYAIRGAIAEFEKKKILERTQRGKRGKAKQGLLPGYVNPFGYDMDTEADKLVVNETEAFWVKKIFEWASDPNPDERMGQWRIAERLNQMGVPAPRGQYWYRSTVAGILKNPLYTGVLSWGKYDHSGVYQARRVEGVKAKKIRRKDDQVIDLPVPALVDPEVFARVHEFIQLDKHRRSRGKTYMLTGIAVCGRCGGHVQSKTSSHRYLLCSNRYPAYRDMSVERRATTQPCDLPYIQAGPVEEFVWETICEWVRNPSALEKAATVAGTSSAVESNLKEEITIVASQITELEQAQARVIALVARANIKQEIAEHQLTDLAKRVEALTSRGRQLEGELSRVSSSTAAVSQVVSVLETLALEVGTRLDLLSEDNRISLVRRLVRRVVISGPNLSDWTLVPLCMNQEVPAF